MISVQYCKTAVAIAALFAASGGFAATMSKPDYSAEKDRIGATYKTEKAACAEMKANAKDICIEQAKGNEKVARAELEFKQSGKASDGTKVANEKAHAIFAVAKEKCDELTGQPKDLCRTEAKAVHTKALADAKLVKEVAAAKTDATEDKREADYKVAKEKCETLGGDARAACVATAKARFDSKG